MCERGPKVISRQINGIILLYTFIRISISKVDMMGQTDNQYVVDMWKNNYCCRNETVTIQ